MRKLICNKNGCRQEGKKSKMSQMLGAGGGGFHASNSTYLKPFKQANKRKSYTPKKMGTGKKRKVQAKNTKVSKSSKKIRKPGLKNRKQKKQKNENSSGCFANFQLPT